MGGPRNADAPLGSAASEAGQASDAIVSKNRVAAELRMHALLDEMHALAALVAPSTLKHISAKLMAMRAKAGGSDSASELRRLHPPEAIAAGGASAPLHHQHHPHRATAGASSSGGAPVLLADEAPRRLCAARPPWGILASDARQIGAPANWSHVLRATPNRTHAHMELCMRFAERQLQRLRNAATHPPTAWNRSCAIVGSGGSLRGSGYGAEIDGHQMVMRFNAAPAGGNFAADVGARTTLRLLTDKQARA